LAAVIGELVGLAAEQGGYFDLDRLRQHPSRSGWPWYVANL
jgi:hypothetical protein